MTKTLTEQWREGTLDGGYYYVKLPNERPQIYHSDYLKSFTAVRDAGRIEIIDPVPSYRQLFGPNDGNMPTGLFTVLKIIKRDIDNAQKRRSLTDLECGIKSQVVSLLKKWGIK